MVVAWETVERARPLVLAGERLLPVAEALAGLLPDGALRRGTTVGVAGSTSLALALLAAPVAAGSWAAVVGMPTLGVVAAAELGVDLSRLALVPEPGRQWPVIVAALLDGVDLVLVRPSGPARPSDARRLAVRVRERGAVLLALGDWEGADVRLQVTAGRWEGLEQGAGHLRAHHVEVVADGRGAAARPRRARLWLPAHGGGIAPGGIAMAPSSSHRPQPRAVRPPWPPGGTSAGTDRAQRETSTRNEAALA